MRCLWFKDHQGSVLLFTIIMLMPLLVIGAIAMDLGYVGSVRREMQRSMDAAALAGAGNLGFDATAFPAARAAAQNYAGLNGYSHYDPMVGDIDLDLNPTNLPDGNIVLGIWDGDSFEDSLNGNLVNAVQCQFEAPIPTSFLSMLALDNLTVSASAIAVSNPPETIPDDTCVFPIALSCCSFGGCQSGTSSGCGSPVTFITSAAPLGDGCIAPPCTNTGSWARQCDTQQPNNTSVIAEIIAAAAGDCTACNTDGEQQIGTNNGMLQNAFTAALVPAFIDQYNNGETYTVTDSGGNVTYTGRGWKVFVPIVSATECPAQEITGPQNVIGWTEFVMTAVVDLGTCNPGNPDDTNLPVLCPNTGVPSMRAIFGYYNCILVDGDGSRDPGPRSALGTNLRLVQ